MRRIIALPHPGPDLRGITAAGSKALPAAVLAFVFGTFILFVVGFSPVDAIHNTAHDGRHVAAFPCH